MFQKKSNNKNKKYYKYKKLFFAILFFFTEISNIILCVHRQLLKSDFFLNKSD